MTLIHEGCGSPSLAEPGTVSGRATAGISQAKGSAGVTSAVTDDLGGGILRITLPPGGRITGEDGAVVREQLLARSGGAGVGVLLQITGVEYVSREAVRFLSEAATITAFAILGDTPVDRVIAHSRHGLPAPRCPSRYFSDEQEAWSWLRALAKTATDIAG